MTFYVKDNNKISLYSIDIDIYKLSSLKRKIDLLDDKGILRNKKNISYVEFDPHFLSILCYKFIDAKNSLEITKIINELIKYLDGEINANEICLCKELIEILNITKVDNDANKLLQHDIKEEVSSINNFFDKFDKIISKKEEKSIQNSIFNSIPEYSNLYLIMN
ncbi:MAG: hypothetical protein NC181_03450 [Clostridium sp.]|nr:hypothetical protein [Clostridium sp.]MCM1444346.1 hypothetical protein [Candidatus Amulumruptor caecigallinarius]